MDGSTGFKALIARETSPGSFSQAVEERTLDSLPTDDLLVRVDWSSLNYKDALSATGTKGVTSAYPHTPGIDAAGEVVESRSPAFAEGALVIISGFELGVSRPGGFGRYIRVPASWALPLPQGLGLREAMIYGTAGLTAALATMRILESGLPPDRGALVVTGASGGVGSFAAGLLSREGYRVAAVTGKPDAAETLRRLGVAEILPRETLANPTGKLLLGGRWAGGIDTVGGAPFAALLRSIKADGVVVACGNAAGSDFAGSLFPFILRGLTLHGIDAASKPVAGRAEAWRLLAGPWRICDLVQVEECGLEELIPKFELILAGKVKGRIVVRHG